MKKFRKILLSALSLVLVVALTIVGTVAFLQDEDGEVNVMTVGNVYIEQLEQEWNNNGELQDFTQAKPLYPVPNVELLDASTATVVAGLEKYPVINEKNVVDKYVSIKNIGKSEAYVRTVFAFEMGDVTLERFNEIFVASRNGDDYDWSDGIVIQVGGVNYYCVVATYKTILGSRRTTAPSLYQVFLKSFANNEDCMKIDGNKNGAFDILTMSQAVQTEGFKDNTATYALNAAFGAITTITHPWTEVAPELKVTATNEEDLANALANGGVIYLANDIEVDEIELTVYKGVTAVLNLNDYEIKSNIHKSNGAVIANYGDLTIIGGTISSTGNNGGSAVANKAGATLTVVNSVLNGAPNADGSWPSYTVNNAGTMVINDSTITSYHGAVASYGDGALATLNNTAINMRGIPGFTSHGIYTYNNGAVIVNNAANVTIANYAADQNASGASAINGNVTVNGGNFVGRIENYYGTPVINAGTFNNNPTRFAGKNVIKDNGNGTWTVYPETDTWDGTADTSWYNAGRAVTTEYKLYTAEQLAGLAKLVNVDGVEFKNSTITLMVNVDLDNKAWTPIGYGKGFVGTHPSSNYAVFDGNNKTISNLNVNVDEYAGLFGAATYVAIKNVVVDGATVKSTHYAGVVLAQGYARVENCTVKNATVTCAPALVDGEWDNGDKVGGVAGQILESGSSDTVYGVVNCTVDNVSVTGYRDVGGVLGFAAAYAKVTGNKVTNVTVAQDLSHDYKGFGENNTKSNINVIVGDSTRQTGVLVENNTYNGVDFVVAKDANAALKELGNGDSIALPAGEFSLPTLSGKDGITIVGTGNTVIGGENSSTGFGGNFGKNTTITGVIFSGSTNGVRYSYAQGGKSVFNDCTFAGDSTYGFHIDESKGAEFVFNNCTFIGFNAFAGDLKSVTFNNCTFLSNGRYGHTNIWSIGYFNNCTFGEGVTYGCAGGDSKIYINGSIEANDADTLGNALASGDKVVLTDSINNAPVITTAPYGNKYGVAQNGGVLDGNGNALNFNSSGDNYGIMTSGGTIKNLTVTGSFRGIVIMSPKADVYIDNVTVGLDKDTVYGLNTAEGDGTRSIYVSNSTLGGWNSFGNTIKSVTFTDCTFVQGAAYSSVTGRLVRPYVTAVFENCDFSDKYYIDLSALVAGHTVTLKNCTVNGVKLTAENWTSLIAPEDTCGAGQISIEGRNGTYMSASNVFDYVVIQ